MSSPIPHIMFFVASICILLFPILFQRNQFFPEGNKIECTAVIFAICFQTSQTRARPILPYKNDFLHMADSIW